MEVFMDYTEEYIAKIVKERKDVEEKWQNCPLSYHCAYSNTTRRIYHDYCKTCKQERPITLVCMR